MSVTGTLPARPSLSTARGLGQLLSGGLSEAPGPLALVPGQEAVFSLVFFPASPSPCGELSAVADAESPASRMAPGP